MDIGTSKIRPSEMRGFEHRLLDIADPASKLPLETYVARARQELSSLVGDESTLPILVGGTGVYVQSLVRGWNLEGTADLRRSLERDFPRSDAEGAYLVLQRLDPAVAKRVSPRNYEAIINALVRRMGTTGDEQPQDGNPFRFSVFGIDRGVEETDRRIETTLDQQLARGLLEEIIVLDQRFALVQQLRRSNRVHNAVLETHGYREFVARAAQTGRQISKLTNGDIGAARADALEHIVAYARRQRSWFPKLSAVRVDHRSGVTKMLASTGLTRGVGREI